MQDTAVLAGLDQSVGDTQLLTIVANERGAKDACAQKKWIGWDTLFYFREFSK